MRCLEFAIGSLLKILKVELCVECGLDGTLGILTSFLELCLRKMEGSFMLDEWEGCECPQNDCVGERIAVAILPVCCVRLPEGAQLRVPGLRK